MSTAVLRNEPLLPATYNCCALIECAKKYINENYSRDVSRAEVASFVHITPNYLSKLFGREVGMSLREYINKCRIDEACYKLSSTEEPISRIAIDVGFENISYFSTVFRKYCGISPMEWRSAAVKEISANDV